jgi:hypothetical protein
MTNQGGGGRQPPPDDRTLLDPLNADELKALREARQKMQAAKGGGAVAHQVVIGPDSGEDIGDAPTRAMPALPQFENQGASLEKIPTRHQGGRSGPAPQGAPRASQPEANRPNAAPPPPQAPMSMNPTQPAGGGPTAGSTGFGENTLLWMAPPKPPMNLSAPTGIVSAAEIQKAKKAAQNRRLMTIGGVVALLFILFGGYKFMFRHQERAVIDLHTNPSKAVVKINGTATRNLTPMKLNLVEGNWEIEVSLEGYKPYVFNVKVEPGMQPSRKEIDLEPISRAGMVTVAIAVQPVAANITVDGNVNAAKRTLNLKDMDPNQPHKISIEAGGYLKIDQDIPAGQLKKTYNFFLQQDENNKPGKQP